VTRVRMLHPSDFCAANTSSDVMASVSHVSLGAMRTAWHKKWARTMRIRPEVFAQRLELARRFPELIVGPRRIPGLGEIQKNMETAAGLLQMVLDDNQNRTGGEGSLLLALQYPEGSPAHPSLPAGEGPLSAPALTASL
jgi:hypothetical protein